MPDEPAGDVYGLFNRLMSSVHNLQDLKREVLPHWTVVMGKVGSEVKIFADQGGDLRLVIEYNFGGKGFRVQRLVDRSEGKWQEGPVYYRPFTSTRVGLKNFKKWMRNLADPDPVKLRSERYFTAYRKDGVVTTY